MRANYNARPCAGERKAAGARTMGINGITMRRTMETMRFEKQSAPEAAPDARMSLCTYCHAPLAPAMQAEFDLSPLFAGAPIMAVAATAAAARRDGSTAPRPSASGLPDPSANGKVGPHR